MFRVFANGPEDLVQSQVESYQRLKNGTWCLRVLCFDPAKMPFKVMHPKEVTHSDGSYERKSRGLMKWDDVKKKKSHYTLIDWRTGREWSLNWMTVISTRWWSHRPFQRKRKWHIPVDRYRKELRRRVHITAWEFEGNVKPTNWTEDSWVPVSWVQRASRDRRVELRR